MDDNDLLREVQKRLNYHRESGTFTRKAHTGVAEGQPVGSQDKNGVIQASICKKRVQVDALVWLVERGHMPTGCINHINGDKSDCRISNLEDITRKEKGKKDYWRSPEGMQRTALWLTLGWIKDEEKERQKAIDKEERRKARNAKEREYQRKRREEQPERVRQWMKDYYERAKGTPEFQARASCHRLIHDLIRRGGDGKQGRTEETLGYTVVQFRQHMEAQFEDWMSWDNQGEWHIDHIKPVSAFLREGVTDPKIINALDNLQPLSAEENIRKSDRHEDVSQRTLVTNNVV